jgi:hypothetical protein
MVEVLAADSRVEADDKPTMVGVVVAENTAVADKGEQRTGNRTEPRH